MKTPQAKVRDSALRHEAVPVILLRHAQSQWNKENRFTGWANPPLTPAGVSEAIAAGEQLRVNGYRFDVAYSSRLQRAISTLEILLESLGKSRIPTQFEIPTATPILYRFERNGRPLDWSYFDTGMETAKSA